MPKKVLIVDDSAVDRLVLSKLLGKEYTVVEAENGKEAYSILLGNPFGISAVVADVVMPVMDGYG